MVLNKIELLKKRHSVRVYKDESFSDEIKIEISRIVREINEEHNLNFQEFFDEPEVFAGNKPHYGAFKNVKNYIVFTGKPSDREKIGFYGEEIVLKLVELGISSCWCGLTFKKSKLNIKLNDGEKVIIVLAIGYALSEGKAHKSKSIEDVLEKGSVLPEEYKIGVEAMLLAPTAINQQKFKIRFENNLPIINSKGIGPFLDVDLGIVKYHFEFVTLTKTNRDYWGFDYESFNN